MRDLLNALCLVILIAKLYKTFIGFTSKNTSLNQENKAIPKILTQMEANEGNYISRWEHKTHRENSYSQ